MSAENLVASVQLYEPGMPIFVYDLGLTANQRQIVSSWTGVSLIAIDWTTLPAHMMQLKHCAWKPAVIKDAVERVDSVLYLDAGLELRWDLEPIKADMEEIGYWLILDKQNLEKFVHPSQYDALGVERGAFRNDVDDARITIHFIAHDDFIDRFQGATFDDRHEKIATGNTMRGTRSRNTVTTRGQKHCRQ